MSTSATAGTEMPRSHWLRRNQVARRLDVTGTRVDQLAREGKLQFQDTALGRLFRVESVEALKAEREAKNAPTDTDGKPGGAAE